jgi:hypothetical protein
MNNRIKVYISPWFLVSFSRISGNQQVTTELCSNELLQKIHICLLWHSDFYMCQKLCFTASACDVCVLRLVRVRIFRGKSCHNDTTSCSSYHPLLCCWWHPRNDIQYIFIRHDILFCLKICAQMPSRKSKNKAMLLKDVEIVE